MTNNKDTERLRWLMDNIGIDGIFGLKMDRYEYASKVAESYGNDEPNDSDYLDGFRAMIDAAMEKYKK